MFQTVFGRGALLAAGLFLMSAAGADAASYVKSPDCASGAAGQPELKPLQPLTLVTSKGRFRFAVEDADDDAKRETGLMCRTRLAPDRGMLFDFLDGLDAVRYLEMRSGGNGRAELHVDFDGEEYSLGTAMTINLGLAD